MVSWSVPILIAFVAADAAKACPSDAASVVHAERPWRYCQDPKRKAPSGKPVSAKERGIAGAGAGIDPMTRYAQRTAADRPKNPRVSSGLEWLVNHQDEDGRWDCDQYVKHENPSSELCDGCGNAVHDVGVTALALLAFLGDGNTMDQGKHAEPVRKAVQWLCKEQDPKSGIFGSNRSHDFIYCHAIATYAICEAFGLSKNEALRAPAQSGIDYLEFHRNDAAVWRYQPNDGDNDTSVTGWCISAYVTAEAFGLKVDKGALKLAGAWMRLISDDSGRHGYSSKGEPSARKPGDHASLYPVEVSEAITAEGLFSRCLLDPAALKDPVAIAAARRLAKLPPAWRPREGRVDMYYWYFGAHAMFQVGGSAWADWQKRLEVAAASQHADPRKPNLFGSWDPVCVWGEDGGRIYSTAMMILALEAEYRYARMVR